MNNALQILYDPFVVIDLTSLKKEKKTQTHPLVRQSLTHISGNGICYIVKAEIICDKHFSKGDNNNNKDNKN